MQATPLNSIINNCRSSFVLTVVLLVCLPILFSCNKVRKKVIEQQDTALPVIKHSPGAWKQKEFLISYCCSAPPKEINMAHAAAEHFNLVPAWQETLDFANKHHVKVMLEHGLLHPTTIHSPDKLKQLDALIEQVKNHPALGAYYVFDEPDRSAFADVGAFVEYLRKRDPKHLAFVNMLPIYGLPGKPGTDPSKTYLEFLRQYIEAVRPELLSYDFYTFYRDKSGVPYDLPYYFVNLTLVRQAALQAHIPFLNIIQACPAFVGSARMPNANEMRWQVYTTLAYGARGISYFLYWSPKPYSGLYLDGKPTDLLKPVVQLNRELAKLGPELMALNTVSVFHTAPLPFGATALPAQCPVQLLAPGEFVIGFFAKEGRTDSFMIVNRDYKKSATAKLHIAGKTTIREFDRDKAAWNDVHADLGENFTVELRPGDGRLFRF